MGIEEKIPDGILLTTVAKLLNTARKNSVWPAQFGLACCAIEMMAVGGPRFDIARFGMERFSASPRQADLMIVAGRVSQKMAPVLRQIYDQMPEPKWVLAMGVCASSGGMFNNYAIVQGVDHIVPVDMYLPGLPAAAGDAARRDPQAAREDQARPDQRQARTGPRSTTAPYEKPIERDTRVSKGLPVDVEITPYANARRCRETRRDRQSKRSGTRRDMFGASGFGDTSGFGGLAVRPAELASSPKPYGEWFDEATTALETAYPDFDDAIERVVVHRGELTLLRQARGAARGLPALRDDPALRFEMCASVSGVDYLDDPTGRRLHAVYHLLSMTYRRRIRLEVSVHGRGPARPERHRDLPDGQLARARDLGLLRHRLRRPPGADPDRDARRLARPPAAQGLPARRRTGRVQGRHGAASGRAEVVRMSETTETYDEHVRRRPTRTAATDPEDEGRVFTVGGGDWDDVVDAVDPIESERIVVNMGPQHPSTHGVLRLVLELEGETVTQTRAVIGYLHTGIEKNMEYRNWTQAVTFITRCDYLAPLFNEATYCLGVERLLDIEDQIPERVQRAAGARARAAADLLAPGLARHRRHGARRDHRDAARRSASARRSSRSSR